MNHKIFDKYLCQISLFAKKDLYIRLATNYNNAEVSGSQGLKMV